MPRLALVAAALVACAGLAGCDMLGMESPDKVAAQRDAEGRAIGGACRHANRAIEDCYALNKKADKAAVFAGWRDMNDYMRENKLDPVAPQLGPGAAKGEGKSAEAKPDGKAADDKGLDKSEAVVVDKADTKPARKSADQ